jgi:hypothetical protein
MCHLCTDYNGSSDPKVFKTKDKQMRHFTLKHRKKAVHWHKFLILQCKCESLGTVLSNKEKKDDKDWNRNSHYHCPYCQRVFDKVKEFQKHLDRMMTRPEGRTSKVTCKKCGAMVAYSNLARHNREACKVADGKPKAK